MKKRILFIGVTIFLLTLAYFVGDTTTPESEITPEPFRIDRTALTEKVPTEEAALSTSDEPETDQKDVPAKPEKVTEEKSLVSTEEPQASTPTENTITSGPVRAAELEDTVQERTTLCTLSVQCDEVLSNLDKLKKGKEAIIPQDGVFYPKTKVEFSEGESVFDILYRELRSRGIHFEFVKTPAYNSVYIEGIGNLYEFDCGDYSGWTYRVNGVKPNVGCSQYQVQKGDVITVSYTCNFLKER